MRRAAAVYYAVFIIYSRLFVVLVVERCLPFSTLFIHPHSV